MRSSGSQTSTTTSEPPAYLRPYLQTAAQQSSNLYNRGGTPVTGFSPDTEQALTMARERAMMGSPLLGSAQKYAQTTLEGKNLDKNPFLSQFMSGVNPYADKAFEGAARSTRSQLASEFGRAGRSYSDAEGIRGEQLNDLATQIYGGAYENAANRGLSAYMGERQAQQGLVPFAGSLANADYTDIGQLANVGAQREALMREINESKGRNLDEFIARLQGFPGGTVTQSIPTERNILGGALSGATAGSVFGPWGMLGGAILGGLYG